MASEAMVGPSRRKPNSPRPPAPALLTGPDLRPVPLPGMAVTGIDHIALPTSDASRFLAFYRRLGFGIIGEREWKLGTRPTCSITFGDNKINVHPETMVSRRGDPEYLRGPTAEPGCGDVCFVWAGGVDALLATLSAAGVQAIEGPVARVGGRSGSQDRGISVYTRDPDGNLIEFISYDAADLERFSTSAH
jgi:catechol 2,3-dioxygenase-like lactoylglutathione lyase family enzyme